MQACVAKWFYTTQWVTACHMRESWNCSTLYLSLVAMVFKLPPWSSEDSADPLHWAGHDHRKRRDEAIWEGEREKKTAPKAEIHGHFNSIPPFLLCSHPATSMRSVFAGSVQRAPLPFPPIATSHLQTHYSGGPGLRCKNRQLTGVIQPETRSCSVITIKWGSSISFSWNCIASNAGKCKLMTA